jgi:hypothetical protein
MTECCPVTCGVTPAPELVPETAPEVTPAPVTTVEETSAPAPVTAEVTTTEETSAPAPVTESGPRTTDSNECLWAKDGWAEHETCENSKHLCSCPRWGPDLVPCCPVSCGVVQEEDTTGMGTGTGTNPNGGNDGSVVVSFDRGT